MKKGTKKGGQAIVELAFVFPFFLLIILGGVVDFGFAFYNFLTLQQIARDAASMSAEGNRNQGLSDAQIRDYIFHKKPDWWKGNFLIPPIEELTSSDGQAKIKKIYLVYESPMFTPFYQLIFEAAAGKASIRLVVTAAFQVPCHVF